MSAKHCSIDAIIDGGPNLIVQLSSIAKTAVSDEQGPKDRAAPGEGRDPPNRLASNSKAESRSAPPRALKTSARADGGSRALPKNQYFLDKTRDVFYICSSAGSNRCPIPSAPPRPPPRAAGQPQRQKRRAETRPRARSGCRTPAFRLRTSRRPVEVFALLACSAVLAKTNLEAIDRVVEIVREFDRAHGFAAAGCSHKAKTLSFAA